MKDKKKTAFCQCINQILEETSIPEQGLCSVSSYLKIQKNENDIHNLKENIIHIFKNRPQLNNKTDVIIDLLHSLDKNMKRAFTDFVQDLDQKAPGLIEHLGDISLDLRNIKNEKDMRKLTQNIINLFGKNPIPSEQVNNILPLLINLDEELRDTFIKNIKDICGKTPHLIQYLEYICSHLEKIKNKKNMSELTQALICMFEDKKMPPENIKWVMGPLESLKTRLRSPFTDCLKEICNKTAISNEDLKEICDFLKTQRTEQMKDRTQKIINIFKDKKELPETIYYILGALREFEGEHSEKELTNTFTNFIETIYNNTPHLIKNLNYICSHLMREKNTKNMCDLTQNILDIFEKNTYFDDYVCRILPSIIKIKKELRGTFTNCICNSYEKEPRLITNFRIHFFLAEMTTQEDMRKLNQKFIALLENNTKPDKGKINEIFDLLKSDQSLIDIFNDCLEKSGRNSKEDNSCVIF